MAKPKPKKKEDHEIIWAVYSSQSMKCSSCKTQLAPVVSKPGFNWLCPSCKKSNSISEALMIGMVRSENTSLPESVIKKAMVQIRKSLFAGQSINPQRSSAH